MFNLVDWKVLSQVCAGKYMGMFWQDSCPFASSNIKDLYKIWILLWPIGNVEMEGV